MSEEEKKQCDTVALSMGNPQYGPCNVPDQLPESVQFFGQQLIKSIIFTIGSPSDSHIIYKPCSGGCEEMVIVKDVVRGYPTMVCPDICTKCAPLQPEKYFSQPFVILPEASP